MRALVDPVAVVISVKEPPLLPGLRQHWVINRSKGALIAGNANKAALAKVATANLILSFIVFLPYRSLLGEFRNAMRARKTARWGMNGT